MATNSSENSDGQPKICRLAHDRVCWRVANLHHSLRIVVNGPQLGSWSLLWSLFRNTANSQDQCCSDGGSDHDGLATVDPQLVADVLRIVWVRLRL